MHKDLGWLDPVRGGYSDQRLWPWYMLISGAALFLIPVVGAFWGLLVVGLPTFWIMHKVAKMQERDPRAVDIAWKRINDLYKELEPREIAADLPAVPVKSKMNPRQHKRAKVALLRVLPGRRTRTAMSTYPAS